MAGSSDAGLFVTSNAAASADHVSQKLPIPKTSASCRNLEERTYTLLRNVVRPGSNAGRNASARHGRGRHPAAQEKNRGMTGRKTPAQKVAALERAERRLKHVFGKQVHRRRTHAMCVLAGAIAAELKQDPAHAPWVIDVVQRRVTKPHELAAVTAWLSTI